MKLPLYQVDAFTGTPFRGNPAAVVLLEEWLPDETLQAIALENNLSETAFVIPRGDPLPLRWFTPAVEVDLCGHATLATAFVLFRAGLARGEVLRFQTQQSGILAVAREGQRLVLDFPSRPPTPAEGSPALSVALGGKPLEVHAARDLLALFETEEDVRSLQPDMGRIVALGEFAIIATAPGRDVDFVSRFFAPAAGVPEDPVTGSAHCTLTPFWARRLGKTRLTARQVSPRGGELFCEDCGERVKIAGEARLYLQGEIEVG